MRERSSVARGLRLAAYAVAVFVGIGIGWCARGYLLVDTCLDRGGRWNAERLECEVYSPEVDIDG